MKEHEQPVLTSDGCCHYLKFNDLEVHSTKTIGVEGGDIVAIDLSGDGTVIGVEIIKK